MQLQLTGQLTGIEARNGGWFAVAFQEQGSNYPKKLSTKKPELVQQAQAMMGQWVTALYNEAESSNINPNSGTPYMNRYLEAMSMAGQMPQQPQPQQFQPQPQAQQQQYPYPMPPQPQMQQPQPWSGPTQQEMAQQGPTPQAPFLPPQQPIVTQQQKEERIMREAAAKVAVQLLDHLDPPDRTLASVVRISEQLVQYFENGVQWSVPPVQTQQAQQHQAGFNGPPVQPSDFGGDPGPQQGDPYHQQGQALPDDDIPFAPSIW